MFTGIVQAVGRVESVKRIRDGLTLEVRSPRKGFHDVKRGESVAVNGVCLTVERAPRRANTGMSLVFFAGPETLARTNLGTLAGGAAVNLERALELGGLFARRLSGHLVQGHVDGTATLVSVRRTGAARMLRFRAPRALSRYLIEKGSVALDGISLTVSSIATERGSQSKFAVMIIPETWKRTHLPGRRPGDRFNVEVDVIARYVDWFMRRSDGWRRRELAS